MGDENYVQIRLEATNMYTLVKQLWLYIYLMEKKNYT